MRTGEYRIQGAGAGILKALFFLFIGPGKQRPCLLPVFSLRVVFFRAVGTEAVGELRL